MTTMITAMIATAALTNISLPPTHELQPASEKKPAEGGFHTDNRLQLTACSLRP
jgi:hypothetical protein